jgi:hypothetical protein
MVVLSKVHFNQFMALILLQQQRMINGLIQKLSNVDNPIRQKEGD